MLSCDMIQLVVSWALLTAQASLVSQGAVRQPQKGTAVISGIVLIDDRDARPLRRARVTLNGDGREGRTAVTEDDGTFRFTEVPAGRYRLTATREGYVTLAFGATRPGRQGKQIVVVDGAQIADITFKLPRGAVITGLVLDVNNQPLASANVRAMRYGIEGGERSLVQVTGNFKTDDRGEFRIFGLAAGEYLIAASARAGEFIGESVDLLSEADIQRARMELKQTAPTPQHADDLVSGTSEKVRPRAATYAPVFYPGSTTVSHAIPAKVGPGEERNGIDIPMQFVPVADLSGTLTGPSGGLPFSVVNLIETGRPYISGLTEPFKTSQTDSSGRFAFRAVSPGIYTLVAESSGRTRSWAQAEIVVSGQDVTDIALTLQPGMTFSGKLQFGDSDRQVPDVTKSRVYLWPAQSNQVTLALQPAQVGADGAFVISGVTPGRYRIRASVASGQAGRTWSLVSATVDGHDTLDFPLDIRPGQNISGAIVTFTDRPTELSGSVRDASGNAAPELYVIVFSADRTFWTPQSRRTTASRGPEGKYSFRNLPPGEYLISAVTDVDDGEWFDGSFLESLIPSALRITLAPGEAKVQDLTIGPASLSR